MEKGEAAAAIPTTEQPDSSAHNLSVTVPPGLTHHEFQDLSPSVTQFHNYRVNSGQCSSLLAQRIHAPPQHVWSILRRFDKPQTYKHFIKSCSVGDGFSLTVGDVRVVNVVSGLPAATSTERLDLLDEERRVTGFSSIGGDHRLKNYRSVASVHEREDGDGRIWTAVLESYVVDVPEGNTEEDTRLFADTVVKLNLQKLASASEASVGVAHT
ncbi:Abscisic acid receptor pyl1 [Castilleja foliolosa]|uniref:Abscisic acid receptor pyl1 n=1 Tax=Castilleja foliolosa TaxID=1961234 RepID=A0ABD3E857_9LAMI